MSDNKTEKKDAKGKEKHLLLLEKMIVQAKPAGPEPPTPQPKNDGDGQQTKAENKGA